MAADTSQDVGRNGLGHIAIQTSRVNFKTRHMPLSSSVSTAKSTKSSFISATACPKQSSRFLLYHSCKGACFLEKLTPCLTRVAISEM
ncbi:hypothetical protein TNCV_1088431 [Trichonephila clavipes]|uniref:Uncharacterized protein n=1 Tax=Trichonephila clavipes TaxID=2585209 RepID=A0A8X6SX40_TRICX|nr:hypothetical protein TNCV_1088431 [Trichonephila clavipes]